MRIVEVLGGTTQGAATQVFAAIRRMLNARNPLTVVVRSPDFFQHTRRPHTLNNPTPEQLHTVFPELDDHTLNDPHIFDDIDIVLATSGSTTGTPRLVGLSRHALRASASATNLALAGPGQWVLALPTHHVAGLQVLVRSALSKTTPVIVDTTNGFNPEALADAIEQVTGDDQTLPVYVSLVGVQLQRCLNASERVVNALAKVGAVLVGGSALDGDMLTSARAAGIVTVSTYGMTETCGGCVYDGKPLPGTLVRALEKDGRDRIAIAGNTLMTRYLEGEQPFFDEAGVRWLLTSDIGHITSAGHVVVDGRADDVIISGGLSIAPAPVRAAVLTTPGVTDAWILGTTDQRWGQAVTAALVLDDATRARVADASSMDQFAHNVRDTVAGRLGRAHAPRAIVLIDRLPLRETGKIDRNAVHHMVDDIISTGNVWRR